MQSVETHSPPGGSKGSQGAGDGNQEEDGPLGSPAQHPFGPPALEMEMGQHRCQHVKHKRSG